MPPRQLALDFTATTPPQRRAERPRRRMPSMAKIEQHWDVPHGYCVRCHQPARCEKAHIIDRCYGGLDGPQNVVPLCYPCHAEQPSYEPGDEPFALEWVFHNRPRVDGRALYGADYEDMPVRFLAAMIWLRLVRDLDEASDWLRERALRGDGTAA